MEMRWLLAALAIGLALLVGGVGTGEEGARLAGSYIFPLALLWAGLFFVNQSMWLRVTLLAIGGAFIVAMFAYGAGFALTMPEMPW